MYSIKINTEQLLGIRKLCIVGNKLKKKILSLKEEAVAWLEFKMTKFEEIINKITKSVASKSSLISH